MIVPKSPNVKVFQSEIAPTSELGGKITTHGGGIQILVSNRSEFSTPIKTDQLADN
jgi:hypothetical protein